MVITHFGNCDKLESFEGDLSSLSDGIQMFYADFKLTSFRSNLISLKTARGNVCNVQARQTFCRKHH